MRPGASELCWIHARETPSQANSNHQIQMAVWGRRKNPGAPANQVADKKFLPILPKGQPTNLKLSKGGRAGLVIWAQILAQESPNNSCANPPVKCNGLQAISHPIPIPTRHLSDKCDNLFLTPTVLQK